MVDCDILGMVIGVIMGKGLLYWPDGSENKGRWSWAVEEVTLLKSCKP
jgi:hypothetical protein